MDSISKVERAVEDFYDNNENMYDWFHMCRVRSIAESIALTFKQCNKEVIILSSLVFDIANPSYYEKEDEGRQYISKLLRNEGVKATIISHVMDIVTYMFFKGAAVETKMKSIEGEIIQDAQRLDCLGAIGIARCFTNGAKKKRKEYDPEYVPQRHITEEAFKNSKTDSLNNFYEEFYAIKDTMNTSVGKKIALQRYKFMRRFEIQFKNEWLGEDIAPVLQLEKLTSPWDDPYFQKFLGLMLEAMKTPVKFEKTLPSEYDIDTPDENFISIENKDKDKE